MVDFGCMVAPMAPSPAYAQYARENDDNSDPLRKIDDSVTIAEKLQLPVIVYAWKEWCCLKWYATTRFQDKRFFQVRRSTLYKTFVKTAGILQKKVHSHYVVIATIVACGHYTTDWHAIKQAIHHCLRDYKRTVSSTIKHRSKLVCCHLVFFTSIIDMNRRSGRGLVVRVLDSGL